MSVSIAEYLGVRTDTEHAISPAQLGKTNTPICPFMNWHCTKAFSGNHPVCAVRNSDGEVWIVCSHRLCSTNARPGGLTEHQKKILTSVAQTIYSDISPDDILYKQEVPITVSDISTYHADYVMWRKSPKSSPYKPERAVVLEMQGGGETSNTGEITRHINDWIQSTDTIKIAKVVGANPLVTNAWRRQQEQFLVKGNVAMLTGGKMVFCVSTLLYDYLMPRITDSVSLTDLQQANWTLALLAFKEDTSMPSSRSIQFSVDTEKLLFTNYNSFVQALTNQAKPSDTLFSGDYKDLDGNSIRVE